MNKLYLIRGNDADGENQDWFVVASNPARARDLWNDHMIERGFPRHDGDEEESLPRVATTDPANIREILPDVTWTGYAGPERAIPWEKIPTVA